MIKIARPDNLPLSPLVVTQIDPSASVGATFLSERCKVNAYENRQGRYRAQEQNLPFEDGKRFDRDKCEKRER